MKLLHYFFLIFILTILFIPGVLLFIQKFVEYGIEGGYDILPFINPSITQPYILWKYSVMINISTILSGFPYLILLFPLILGLVVYGAFLLYKENKAKFIFII